MDRFIPNRSAMNWDYARYSLTQERNVTNNIPMTAESEAYLNRLREVFDFDRTRILEFNNHRRTGLVELGPPHYCAHAPVKPFRRVPQRPERTLDAPNLLDDYCLNLLDWGSSNVLAIALGTTVYLWDASNGSTSELVTVDDDKGPVTSLSWAPDGCRIAVGLNSSEVQLWDSTVKQQLATLRGCHQARVGSLAWNNHILTSGSMDHQIIDHDLRARDHIVLTYKGHQQEVCSLKWSPSGRQLASGGSDHLLHIWDRSMASSISSTKWLHRLKDHTAAVKALAWCPFESNLLVSGGGEGDQCIKFWNTHTGACLKSVDSGSQVPCLLWSKNKRELLSSHGYTKNQLILWKYPSMVKMAELTEHASTVLFMTQSPDGCTVASAAASGDERLLFWNVFEPIKEKSTEPFAHARGYLEQISSQYYIEDSVAVEIHGII